MPRGPRLDCSGTLHAAEVAGHLGVSAACISLIVAKGVISETAPEIIDKWDT